MKTKMSSVRKEETKTVAKAESYNVITGIDDLLSAFRSTRAPRGYAAERTDLMKQARNLKSDLDSLLILNMGNSESTYSGTFHETAGVALAKKKREIFNHCQNSMHLLPGYVLRVENPPETSLVPRESWPVLKLDSDHLEVLEQFNEGLTNVSQLAFRLAEFGIDIYAIRVAHRGDYVHGTVLNRNGKFAYVLTAVQADNETLEFTTVIL